MSADWGAERSREVRWHDPMLTSAAGSRLSGLDFLTAMQDGRLAPPPINGLMRMRLVSAEVGKVVFGCDPDESFYNPIGVVHGGIVCTLLDSAAGCAVHTTLPQGQGYTSIELKVSYLRPVHAHSGRLLTTGTVVKAGRRVAFAAAVVTDEAGRDVATATSSLLVFPLPA